LSEDEDYEAVVATLYEMSGYGIPAEELARLATLECANTTAGIILSEVRLFSFSQDELAFDEIKIARL